MSSSLLMNIRVTVLKMAIIDMLYIHIFHLPPCSHLGSSSGQIPTSQRKDSSSPQKLSSVPGAALLDEQHEVWHIFVAVSLIDCGWILLSCAGELAQTLLKFERSVPELLVAVRGSTRVKTEYEASACVIYKSAKIPFLHLCI